MSEPPLHPTQEELSAYSLGQLPQERAVAIDSHISECQPCCETIVGLSSDDTFVGLLKEARQLPVDQTLVHDSQTAQPSSSHGDIPPELAEHPRYEIVRLIGKGGMGDVYEAIHRKMERRVALKVINRALFQKAEAVNRFHREVKTAAQLSDPNVVTAFDADQAGDFHFMVMEYVDGVDLSHVVKDRGALPIAEACDYIRQAAIGLQHAHECGMVHRDIKPHNLMVTNDGTVKILDFGLASLAPEAIADADAVEARGDLTAAGAIMGTPDFISPEQADDARKADIRSDIYSLGATLYFLLAGRPPFAEGSVTQKLKSHAQAEPKPLKSLRDDVPPELVAIVTKMTAKNPERRFQTPVEVAEALKSFSRSVEPRKGVEPPTQAKPRGWKPTFLSLTAIAALFVAAIVAGVIYYVQTDYGVVRVEVTDPSLQVTINDETITMKDGDEKTLTIRPGKQTLTVRKDDADFEFETDRFQIRRGDEIAFKVEMLQGEIVVLKDGERFNSKGLPDDVRVPRILDRMAKAYAECESYRDSGVIKTVIVENADSPQITFEHSFTTVFERPDRFRFEIKDEDDDKLLISVNGQNVQTWWDVEPGIQKPESLELAMTQAIGFSGAGVGRIPAMLMPQRLDGGVDLDLIDPKPIEDGKLQDVECFRLEYNFRDEQIILWIDKQSYLVRRIDERIKSDGTRIERTTTYDPTIDGKITGKMLEFDPPAPGAVKDSDLKRLQGEWKLLTVQEGDRRESVPPDNALVTVQGNRLLSHSGSLRIEIDGNQAPKTIDFYDEKDGLRLRGIYKFSDDRLIMILHEDGKLEVENPTYPKSFDPPADNDTILWELRKAPLGGSDHEKIQGAWQVVHYADNGRVEPLPFALKMELLFAENLLTYTMEEGKEEVSSFKLDASTTPKSIDLTNGDQVILGIYELRDDQLRICLTQGRKGARAVAFESKPDTTNNILIVAERPRSSAVSPDIAAMLASTGQSEEEFKTKLHTAISHAASIPNAQWEKFATDPRASTAGIEGEPLSLVLLSLDPPKVSKDNPDALKDFRLLTSGVPKPIELHKAMAPSQLHGYVSVIQPDYIKSSNIEIDPATGLLHGSVTFETPDLYAGKIDFAVELKHGRMQVVEFKLPNYGIAISRDEKGLWKRGTEAVKQDPTATDLDRSQGP